MVTNSLLLTGIVFVDPPYIPIKKFTGIPPSAVLGEPYDIECPYESSPPASL